MPGCILGDGLSKGRENTYTPDPPTWLPWGVRTPAAPEPKDLEAVAQGLRRGDGVGGLPAPRRRAGAAGLRSDTAQVGLPR